MDDQGAPAEHVADSIVQMVAMNYTCDCTDCTKLDRTTPLQQFQTCPSTIENMLSLYQHVQKTPPRDRNHVEQGTGVNAKRIVRFS